MCVCHKIPFEHILFIWGIIICKLTVLTSSTREEDEKNQSMLPLIIQANMGEGKLKTQNDYWHSGCTF